MDRLELFLNFSKKIYLQIWPEPSRNLADQLILFKQGGSDYARHSTASPQDSKCYLHLCCGNRHYLYFKWLMYYYILDNMYIMVIWVVEFSSEEVQNILQKTMNYFNNDKTNQYFVIRTNSLNKILEKKKE